MQLYVFNTKMIEENNLWIMSLHLPVVQIKEGQRLFKINTFCRSLHVQFTQIPWFL